MIRLSKKEDWLIVDPDTGDLAPRHESQLAYWGFTLDEDGKRYSIEADNSIEIAEKVTNYFERRDLCLELEESLSALLEKRQQAAEAIFTSKARGSKLKDGDLDDSGASEFLSFLTKNIPRTLKDHQVKSALHLLAVGNGANFSVPGSGKTTVVLSVFQMLRRKGIVDALFVVGPPACFGPWRDEYEITLGEAPTHVTLAGGHIDNRHSKYFVDADSVGDLYLTSFQTLHRDWEKVRTLFSRQGIRFYFIVDEAHYIKQIDGAWATAALSVAGSAERRCVLTGTPFPKSYSDAFNLFDLLWPESSPISTKDKHRIILHSKRNEFGKASEVLNGSVGSLFYRVRKSDLGLAPQIFHEPIMVRMNEHEKTVYDAILDKIQMASQQDYFRDLDLVLRLRRGRMMRLRQCLSYTNLLTTALDDYDEDLMENDKSLANLIHNYDELETPGKVQALVKIVEDLREREEKVVIWSNFVKTLELIQSTFTKLGFPTHLIYGATPLENADEDSDVLTRERIIKEFISRESGFDILVANPAACAESISLHKTCSNAIYYDLSYNCAQYLQSLDRIHRVGGSEDKPSFYYFLQYEKSLDQDVLDNVRGKAERMSQIIDQEYPIYSLDMFDEDDEIAAYTRLFAGESKDI